MGCARAYCCEYESDPTIERLMIKSLRLSVFAVKSKIINRKVAEALRKVDS